MALLAKRGPRCAEFEWERIKSIYHDSNHKNKFCFINRVDSPANLPGYPEKYKYKLYLYERYKREHRQALAKEDRQEKTPPLRRSVRPRRRAILRMDSMRSSGSSAEPPEDLPQQEEEGEMVKIANISVPAKFLQQMSSMTVNRATRKLLIELFPRSVLATHSLSGRPSPAFPGKPVKEGLDRDVVETVIDLVCQRCQGATRQSVRKIITTKLADEAKMRRSRADDTEQ